MKEMTCIVCPKGCHLMVEEESGQITVSGAQCKRGVIYGKKEVTSPTRVLTSTVRLSGASLPRLPVKTKADIPKHFIRQAMALLDGIDVSAPVGAGDTVVADILGTGVPWVATRSMKKKEEEPE